MKVPIACTLSAEDAAERVGEWRAALGATVTAISRPTPGRAELRLVAKLEAIATLIDPAQREKACCEFFAFTFEVGSDGVWLVISVPDDAIAVLDDFAALAAAAWPGAPPLPLRPDRAHRWEGSRLDTADRWGLLANR